MLEDVLLAACESNRASSNFYIQLRGILLDEPSIKPLPPSFVRTSRDLNHFWSYIKGQSGKWEPGRAHVRDAMRPDRLP
jgi:hypothetical protein